MPLKLRCRKCRKFEKISTRTCPTCGVLIPREYWFLKQVNGQRHHKFYGEGTRLEVDAEFKRWCDELKQRLTTPPPLALNLQGMTDAYVKYLEVSRKPYAYQSKFFLDRLIVYVGNIICENLTTEQLLTWQTHLVQSGFSLAYVDRHFQQGKAAWRRVFPDKPNPFQAVKLFKPDNTIIERLTHEEEERLLEAAKHLTGKGAPGNCPWHFPVIMLLYLRTGLRKRNVLQLHRNEVDFENARLVLRQKGNRILRLPVSSEVIEALRKIKPPKGGSGYFFPSLTAKGKPLDDIRRSFEAAKKLAGITRPFRVHGLRHHFGSELLARTKNLALVQRAMDHRDISTTLKYVHVLDDELREGVESLVVVKKQQPDSQGPHE